MLGVKLIGLSGILNTANIAMDVLRNILNILLAVFLDLYSVDLQLAV